jgi:RNA recognition motif-containing protein
LLTSVSMSIPKVKQPSKNGGFFFRKLGYAFVELGSKEEAEKAVAQLNDQNLNDRKISVKLAKSEKKPRKTKENGESSPSESAKENDKEQDSSKKAAAKPVRKRRVPGPESKDTILIKNLPVGEPREEIEELVKEFNPVEIKLTNRGTRRIRRKGEQVTIEAHTLAFIQLADNATQQKAIEALNGKKYKDIELEVKVALELVEGEEETKEEE